MLKYVLSYDRLAQFFIAEKIGEVILFTAVKQSLINIVKRLAPAF